MHSPAALIFTNASYLQVKIVSSILKPTIYSCLSNFYLYQVFFFKFKYKFMKMINFFQLHTFSKTKWATEYDPETG